MSRATQPERVNLGRTGLPVSPVGFGCYRINDETPEHREALTLALKSGCNLIDTSTNYTDGASERLVGSVLAELTASGQLKRNDLVVVSKIGYVQGQNMKQAREREAKNQPFAEMVKYAAECWHCISPEFLADQLTRSLERLKLKQLDVLLLHNPEYYLKTENDHREYYRRIRQAFEHLEAEADAGRIRYYGVSSNTFPDAKDSPHYTSLEVLLDLAREIEASTGKKSRFAVIQFPLNLYEPGAALELNNGGKSVAELAHEAGLGTLVNRPLNAFAPGPEGGLIRLASFPQHNNDELTEDVKARLAATMKLETSYPGDEIVAVQKVAWGHVIRQNFGSLSDLDHWKAILEYQIRPSLARHLATLEADPDCQSWVTEYRKSSQELFKTFTAYLESHAAIRSERLASMLDHLSQGLHSSPTLSQKAIRTYLSIPGIDCVLVGMRRPEYVRDALTLGPALPEDESLRILATIQREVDKGSATVSH